MPCPHRCRDLCELRRRPRLERDAHRSGRARECVSAWLETERAHEVGRSSTRLVVERDRGQPLRHVVARDRREERALLGSLVVALGAVDRSRQEHVAPRAARTQVLGHVVEHRARQLESNGLGLRALVEQPLFDVGPIVRRGDDDVGTRCCQGGGGAVQFRVRVCVWKAIRIERDRDHAQPRVEKRQDLVVAGPRDRRHRVAAIEQLREERLAQHQIAECIEGDDRDVKRRAGGWGGHNRVNKKCYRRYCRDGTRPSAAPV